MEITIQKYFQKMKSLIIIVCSVILFSCNGTGRNTKSYQKHNSMTNDITSQYGYNRDFLKSYAKIIELTNNNASVLIVPQWQGRVMTSTADGDSGYSFGWINHDLIASGKIQPHINPFGGEERIWLGPEGGQYSIFFRKGQEFIYDNWQTPAFIDTMPYELVNLTDFSATFRIDARVENYSGTSFNFRIERTVTLLGSHQINRVTGIDTEGLKIVAYRSDNTLINMGKEEWKKETGLLSVWMLGMYNPSPGVVVAIPYKAGDEKKAGPPVNDNYFGKIPSGRLKVTGTHIFFKADGTMRGKIGIPPLRAKGVMGSYDSQNNFLTLVICNMPEGITEYVNSAWQIQKDPYSGDALNSYNDGPLEDGSLMGPFYELETSSPAAALKPGESLTHVQYTLHITGSREKIDLAARKILETSIDEISGAF